MYKESLKRKALLLEKLYLISLLEKDKKRMPRIKLKQEIKKAIG